MVNFGAKGQGWWFEGVLFGERDDDVKSAALCGRRRVSSSADVITLGGHGKWLAGIGQPKPLLNGSRDNVEGQGLTA